MPFHVCRNGDGMAGEVDKPVVRRRVPWMPLAFGVTGEGGARVAGVFPSGLVIDALGEGWLAGSELWEGKMTVDVDVEVEGMGVHWGTEDSASSPTRRRFVSVVAGVLGGESLIRDCCGRGPKPGDW